MKKYFTVDNISTYQKENISFLTRAFEHNDWNYELNNSQFKLSFLAPPELKIVNEFHVINAFPDKIFTSTSLGIKVCEDKLLEIYKLLNYINSEQLFYGRFLLSKINTIWYDYAIDLTYCDISEEICLKSITIPEACIEKYCNNIVDVNMGIKTAEEVIESYNENKGTKTNHVTTNLEGIDVEYTD